MLATTLIYGFAVFSMFFGSGNLVFPISIGIESTNNWLAGAGLALSAILIPMIGLCSRVQSQQNVNDYFNQLGRIPAGALVFLMMCLLGPLGVLPRCIIVASGGMELAVPSVPFALNGAIICVATYFLANNKNTVRIIGKVFTPFLLGGIVCVILLGLLSAKSGNTVNSDQAIFMRALSTGYQTMDLIAAFFFADALVSALATAPVTKQQQHLVTYRAIYIGFFCLLVTYVLMISVSSIFAEQLMNVEPQMRIVKITELVLGSHALGVASVLIAIACLTTLAVLLNEFVRYVCYLFNIKWQQPVVIASLILSYAWSFIGFSALKIYLGLILEVFYPALMVYSAMKLMGVQRALFYRLAFTVVAIISGLVMAGYL